MHPLLHVLATDRGPHGAFDLSPTFSWKAINEDGLVVSGSLDVDSNGALDWNGDALGNNQSSQWWSPIGSPIGTWHVKLSFTSGTNQYLSGSGLGAWLALSSNRSWTFRKATVGGPDSTFGVYLIEFSNDGGSTVHDSATINTIELEELGP